MVLRRAEGQFSPDLGERLRDEQPAPEQIDTSALSQCETVVAFRSVDQTGLDYLEQIAGGGVRNLVPALRQGEALLLGTAISSDRPVAIQVDP